MNSRLVWATQQGPGLCREKMENREKRRKRKKREEREEGEE